MSANPSPTDNSPHSLDPDRVGYDPRTDTFHTQFDGSDPIVAIVETVGVATDRDPMVMPPLYGVVNSGALSELVGQTRSTTVVVEFSYENCHVSVSSDGCIVVDPPSS